ncbi:a-Factor sex pheromone exporter [Beauveria brongniartii RCEF 3172]|uniref:A-Factor sex pheromone exporter n=1 Tax=Beauveria brongniartii RCEF 3172 TaxID=1081107 RepID=A0A162JR31_9HYPO|nr:a-Factor sex pheromone exporter [Beauveria brongniartii RCEF 3172]
MKEQKLEIESIEQARCVTEILEKKPKWRHLFAFTTTHHVYYLSGAGLSSAAAAALRTALAIILGRVFDIIAAFGNGEITASEALASVSGYSIILVAMGTLQWVTNSTFLALWLMFGELQAKKIRRALFSGLMAMERAWIDSLPNGTTGLVASIQRKTHELQIATSQVFGYLTTDLFTALASLGVALYTSWKLTLVLIATLPPSLVVLALASPKIQPAITKQAAHLDSASKMLAGSLSGIDLVKICNGYSCEVRNYLKHIGHAAKQYRVQARYNSIQIGYISFWAVAMFVVGFWYGLVLVKQGERPGNIVTTFYSVLTALQGIESLLPNWLVFARGMSAGQVLQALKVEVAGATEDDPSRIQPGYFVGAIDLKEVSFSYPTAPSAKCLDKCTLSIPAGEMTFLVGRSGSGKSTIASLVSRTYDVSGDCIYIDGMPIKKLQKKWIQQQVVALEQTAVIFNDTLFRNIVFGYSDPASITGQQVVEACQKFGLGSTIANLTGGVHAIIGGKGCPLSGGQRQRIALARAYLKDPPVLILDEPTSALDPHSREQILNEIREWRRGKTTVIISHDLDTIRHDDYVYVLDQGAVAKSGFKREMVSAGVDVFLAEALNNSSNNTTSHIEVKVNAPRVQGLADSSSQQSASPVQAWLTSKTNSATYSPRVSLLSPRFSVLSNPTRQVVTSAMLAPTAALCSNTLSTNLTGSREPLDISRLSILFNKQFRSASCQAAVDMNARDVQSPPLKPGFDLESVSNHSEPSEFPDRKKRRRLVELGIWSRKQTSGDDISFFGILQTVIPALDTLNTVWLVLGIVMTVIGALTTPAFSVCLARLLAVMWSPGDKVVEGKSWALSLIAIAVVDGVCVGSGRYLLEASAQAWVDSIRRSALASILHQPKSWFNEDKNSQTRIMEAFNLHAEEMRNLVGRFVPVIVSVATMALASVVWALVLSWRMSLVALSPLPLVVVALHAYTVQGRAWETRCSNVAEQTGRILGEALAHGRTVVHYGLETHFAGKYAYETTQCLSLGFKRALYTCPLFGFYQAFSYGMTSLLFYYGMRLMTRDVASMDSVLQVLNLLLFSIGTAAELLGAMPQITLTLASAARVLDYATLTPHGELPAETADASPGRANILPIRVRELAFAYPGNVRPTLISATLDILPGQCTVLVGASGCGKSTLLALLLGLQQPPLSCSPAPSLLYADTPCYAIDPRHLRATVGYVPQTPFLFPASIADNIAYGLDPASPLRHRSNIRAAARDAGIDDFIVSLPEGYDSRVGEGGTTTLSGGQAQRITVARALARHPSLLVMDEPTSALDAESAAAIRACIVELVTRWRAERRPAGVVVATHNVEMMRVADTIIVMDGGRTVEQGPFEDLWFNGDAFRRLVCQNQDDF